MFARIHLNNIVAGAAGGYYQLIDNIIEVLTGTTDVAALSNEFGLLNQGKSYILTDISPSGWSLVFNTRAVAVLSAPCHTGHTKYLSISIMNPTSSSAYTNIQIGTGFNPETGALENPISHVTCFYSGRSFQHSRPLDIWISASPSHVIVCTGTPGLRHNYSASTTYNTALSVFDFLSADTWCEVSQPYLPTCVISSYGISSTAYMTPYPNASGTGLLTAANAVGYVSTRHNVVQNATTANDLTTNGYCLTSSAEGMVPSLLPFAINNLTTRLRGGSVTDLCNVYLAPSSLATNAIIRPADSPYDFHILNIDGHPSGLNVAVPRG